MKFATRQTRCKRSGGNRRSQAGFTFAEVLAALLFMAIVIPVAIEGLRIASRAGIVAERKSVAAQLADSMLNDLIVTGKWRESGQQRGTFGDQWPGFRWMMKNELWNQDALRLVSVEVTYPVQNQEYNVRLSTLMPDASP